MAFDEVKINTPPAIVIWLNSLVTFLIALLHYSIQCIHVFQDPHKYVSGGYSGLLPATGFDIFLVATAPLYAYLPGLYAYHSRGYLSRIYAGFLGIGILIANILMPSLQSEVAMKQSHTSHLFLYIALSQLVYAFFGKCSDKF